MKCDSPRLVRIKNHHGIIRRRGTLPLAATLLFCTACGKSGKEEKPPAAVTQVTAPAKEGQSKTPRAPVKSHGPANPHGTTPAPAHGTTPAPAHGAATPPAAPKLAITWDTPKGWQEDTKPRMMRAATYHAPGDKGPAEIAVFFFGANQGGDVESNIARWIGQFQDVPEGGVKRASSEANGLTRYTVSIAEGSFASGMPGQAPGKEDKWGMEGAIVETPSGRYFFKMTGPAPTVASQKGAFVLLLDSIKTKD